MADKDTKDLAAATGTGQLPVHHVQNGTSQKTCYCCKGQHHPNGCPFKDSTCHGCGKKGHILKACKTKSTPPTNANPHNKSPKTSKPQHSLQTDNTSDSTEASYTLFHIDNQNHPPINVNLSINEHEVRMELDTGAAISVISEETY